MYINGAPETKGKLNKLDNLKKYGYDEKIDIWSLGIIFYEMKIGNCFCNHEKLNSEFEKVYFFLPSELSSETTSFLYGMLKYDLQKRLSAEQLYRHDFLNKNIKDFHKIELNKIKEYAVGRKKKMNIKLDYQYGIFIMQNMKIMNTKKK